MRKKRKSFSKSGKLLCLMLAVVLMLGAMPMYGTFASAGTDEPTVETTDETPTSSVEPTTPEPAAAPAPQGEPEATPAPSKTPTPGETPEGTGATYANSISGLLWLDANENGIYDSGEQPLADYPVYLYVEGDTDNAVQTATTNVDGIYRFVDISSGRYVVGIKAEENGTGYLLPLMGVQNDNKFYFTPDYSKVISNPIDIGVETIVEDIDAAMRTMPQIQPMANATYTIDINNPVITGIPGVTYASGILTFTTSVDLTDTYIITGTGASTTNRIVVNDGVGTALAPLNITLSEVRISNSASPFCLLGTTNVNLTLSGTNLLTCTGTLSAAGNYQAGLYVAPNATLSISGYGTLDATGGLYGAGIGGSYISATGSSNSAGTIIINSGTVTAQGGTYGAGIGGGGATSASGSGGNITINGGTVIAKGSAAGIGTGGDRGGAGIITITGGTITATATMYGAGIGAGTSGSGGGAITITGGTITATGVEGMNNCPGIGGTGVTTTITGGTVTAIGSNTRSTSPGIGGTGATTIITSGSVLPRTFSGTISATPVPTNGSTNGSTLLYMTTVTVVDASNIPVADALVSVERPTYTYEAYTNSSGIAYIWVPTGSQLFEGQHDDYGYGSTDATVAANNTNAVTIVLGMRTTLSRTPDTIAFISTSDPTPVTLNVKAENKVTGALKDIISAQWFRMETTDTTYIASKTSFDSGYATASSSNKGDDTTNLVETAGGNSSEKSYTMPVDQNGKYWVMVHYKDGLGVDRYQVKSIVIDNVYTPSTLTFKGVNVSDSSEIVFPSTNYTGAGVAYQLDSTTIIYSTADGTTAVSGTGAQITLTAPVHTPYWITPSPASYTVDVDGVALGEKVFTYAKDPAWWVTITYTAVMDTGGSVSIVSNTNPTSVKLNVARTNAEPNVNAAALNIELVGYRDSNSATPTAVIPIITTFTPSANTTITFVYKNSGFTVTEKYVDQSGNPIPHSSGAGDVVDTSQFVNAGNNYSGTPAPSGMPSGYICIGYKIGSATDTFATATAGTSGNTNPTISSVAAEHTVWYIYAQEIGSIKIEKYAHDGTTLLPGAEFKLEKLTGPGGSVTSIVGSMTTGAGGSVTFTNLPAGSYQITEMESPQGYELLTEPFEVTIPTDVTYAVGVTPTDTNYLYSTTSGGNVTYHYYDVTYKVSDQASIAMPSAGATNTLPPYALWGGSIILLAALCGGILWAKRRRAYAPKHG